MSSTDTSLMQARNALNQNHAQEVQQYARQVRPMGTGIGGQQPVDKDKKLRESCEGFESIFIQKMWEQMRATVPKSNFLHGREEQFWQGMYDQELSKKMASAGGIGLADMMYEQLSRNLVSASRTTASAASMGKSTGEAIGQNSQGSGFTVTAAPLIPHTAPVQVAAHTPLAHEPLYEAAALYTPESGHESNTATPIAHTTHTVQVPTALSAPVSALTPAPASGEEETSTSPIVQQFLAELQQRQAAAQAAQHAPYPTAQPNMTPTGPELAQKAINTAASKPPLQGVMPATQNHSPFVAAPAPNQAHNEENTTTAEQENTIHTTFTTNVPPKNRRSPKRGQRVPSGQPLIRTLGSATAGPTS